MFVRILLSATAICLAACNGGDTPQPGASERSGSTSVAAPAGFSGDIKPGRWKVSSVSSDTDPQEAFVCIGPEQAASRTFIRGPVPEGCKIARNQLSGGQIDFALRCEGASDPMSSSMKGSYSATEYSGDITLTMNGTTSRAVSKGVHVAEACESEDQRLAI